MPIMMTVAEIVRANLRAMKDNPSMLQVMAGGVLTIRHETGRREPVFDHYVLMARPHMDTRDVREVQGLP